MLELLQYEFFRNALIGIVIVSLISAVIGTYIVTRRMVFISGGITHACFGGLGMGYWLGISPLATAALFAVAGALGVDRLSKMNVRKDSAIAVIWALGMALGILFIFMTSGYVPELNTFLFGNVLTITSADLWIFGGFTTLALLLFGLTHRVVIAVSFDEDFARTRHLPVTLVNTMMTLLVAVSIVLTIRMIGIMLLMSLMSLPQMTAELYTRRYGTLLRLSALLSLLGCIGGLTAAYYMGVPASAAIVLLLVVIYTVAALLCRYRSRLSGPPGSLR